MSTSCIPDPEPNLLPRPEIATGDGAGRSPTQENRREESQTLNASLNYVLRAMIIDCTLASSSWVPDRPKYYFSLHGTLLP
jgi:hypothetical protein